MDPCYLIEEMTYLAMTTITINGSIIINGFVLPLVEVLLCIPAMALECGKSSSLVLVLQSP